VYKIQCIKLHSETVEFTVQLFALFVTSIKKLRADDLDYTHILKNIKQCFIEDTLCKEKIHYFNLLCCKGTSRVQNKYWIQWRVHAQSHTHTRTHTHTHTHTHHF